MALDDLPGTLAVPARDDIATQWRRDYGIVSPGSDTSDGSYPDAQAKTMAITLLPIYSDAVLIANGINEDAATFARLDRVGARYGVPRPQAVGASGYVTVSAAAGGGTIQLGDEIKNRQSGKRYQAAETKTLVNLGQIRIVGVDTGPSTNLNGGATLQWSLPRPGIGQTATVVPVATTAPTGPGLTGGADVANDASYLAVIREARRNPANADNDAAIQAVVTSTPGLAIQQVFSYPCVFGPGTYAFAFLLSVPTGTDPQARIPTAAQNAASLAWLTGQMPGDDSYFVLTVTKSAAPIAFRVKWDPSTLGWSDSAPWPAYQSFGQPAGTAGTVVFSAVLSSTAFSLSTDNGDYTAAVQPQVGQSIAIWDYNALLFRRKTIATISGTGPWVITTDPLNPTSDASYLPVAGERAMPWSDSLAGLVQPLLAYYNNMGPGEMFASFSSDGRRQRRNPLPPKKYPQVVSTDVIVPVLAVQSVMSATLVEGTNALTVGAPGINVFLRTLDQICIFPA